MSSENTLDARGLGKSYLSFRSPLDRLKQVFAGRRRSYQQGEFWALRDVSFSLARGEALGLIGRNGSGKSTLLQILAGTLSPTVGSAVIEGRIGALLELGSGFDLEFTGRENVLLQGAILGFPRDQVAARVPDIEAFAEIGAFFDQPVRTYSSGMFVRLAFAVQAMLVPEVLIVDEALSVGDAPFQIKCMNHMRNLLASGISVILASHDMEAVRSLCSKVLWIHAGEVRRYGDPKEVTTAYMRFLFGGDAARSGSDADAPRPREDDRDEAPTGDEPLVDLNERVGIERWGTGHAQIVGASLSEVGRPRGDETVHRFGNGCRLRLVVEVAARRPHAAGRLDIAFSIRNVKALNVLTATTADRGERLPGLEAGDTVRVAFEFDNVLSRGEYGVVVAAEEVRHEERVYHDFVENAFLMQVVDERTPYAVISMDVTTDVSIVQTQSGS